MSGPGGPPPGPPGSKGLSALGGESTRGAAPLSGQSRTPAPTRRALLAALAALAPACATAQRPGVLAVPFALPDLPPQAALRPLGALEIDPARLGFGGLSAIHLAPDLTVTMVSDLARWAELRLDLDESLRPRGLALLRAGPLRDGAGRPLRRGHAGDSEALARLPDGGWLVAYERWHRIRHHPTLDAPGLYVEAPPGVERAAANGGLESLAVLPDGRWLAIAEELPLPEAEGATAAWIGGPGAWRPIGWRPAPGHAPTDAAPLPDGGLLVLERAFSIFAGFTCRLVRVPAAALADPPPGTILEGEAILAMPPFPADNWEGVAVARHRGRTLVALVSDDNENRLQRSLMMLFELRD